MCWIPVTSCGPYILLFFFKMKKKYNKFRNIQLASNDRTFEISIWQYSQFTPLLLPLSYQPARSAMLDSPLKDVTWSLLPTHSLSRHLSVSVQSPFTRLHNWHLKHCSWRTNLINNNWVSRTVIQILKCVNAT